jgi:uncharacterized membrane protein
MKTNVAILLASLSSLVASNAFALPVYLKNFNDFYKENGIDVSLISDKYKCATCHTTSSGGSRNDYGKDVAKSIKAGTGFSGAEFTDSDNDSFNNLEELYAGTAPGLADEKYDGKLEIKVVTAENGTSEIIITGQTDKCTDMTILSFGFKVAAPKTSNFTNQLNFDASSFSSVNLALENKDSQGAILAKCPSEKKVGSLQTKPN